MFAVIRTGGKQYRVAAESVIKVDKVAGAPGDLVEFGEVLVVGGDTPTLGTPTIAGASVAAEVVEQARGPKVIAFKKRRRKNSRRKRGHRQGFTLVRITEILTDGQKPSPIERKAKSAKPRTDDAAAEAAAADADAEPATEAETSKAKAPLKKPVPTKKSSKPAKRGDKK